MFSKKILVFLLVFFVLFDLILFLLLNINKVFYKSSSLKFTTRLPNYNFKTGEIKYKSGSFENGILSTAIILTTVVSTSHYNDASKSFIVPVIFINQTNKKHSLNLNLGTPSTKILVQLAKNGNLDSDKQIAKLMNTNEIVNLIKKDTPLIVEFYFDKEAKKYDNQKCNQICKDFLNQIQLNYSKSSEILISLSGNDDLNKELTIYNIAKLIIYEN